MFVVVGGEFRYPSLALGSHESPSANNAFDFVVGSPQAGRERAKTTRLADLHSARSAARGGGARTETIPHVY